MNSTRVESKYGRFVESRIRDAGEMEKRYSYPIGDGSRLDGGVPGWKVRLLSQEDDFAADRDNQ